ncbi:MAG TPA: hypothetical protein VKO83_03860 [Steroidobacteraceae bacterium]|nr:hypothetical protein [Steroidobacteraceae bacterium]
MKKYSEELIRHPAVTAEGKPCEVLERITYERWVAEDGSLSQAVEINRRYDLPTGELLIRLGEREFEADESGARIHLRA